jgi:exosortase C (VPDSG-CTERM-specific)
VNEPAPSSSFQPSILDSDAGAWVAPRRTPRHGRLRVGAAAGWIGGVTLAFVQPLTRLLLHAAHSDLFSYILLVPFVAGYLFFIRPRPLVSDYCSSISATLAMAGIGLAALAAGIDLRGRLSVNDGLAVMTLAYLSFVAAGGFLFLGSQWMAAAAFPAAFLIFMVPLPDAAVNWLESASVLASADVSAWFFKLTGTPMLRDGTVFALPTIVIRVAQECSGIRSSWVLLITSLIGANLLLETTWRRILLVVVVIPLAIVRNAFRILVIGLLCVHLGPHMIDSVIHHRGGPLFFALSLIPLFLLLYGLRRSERQA